MKKSKTEPTYVTLSKCGCGNKVDVGCNFCRRSLCCRSSCLKRCRICNTVACRGCYDEISGVCVACKNGKEGRRDCWIDHARNSYRGKLFGNKDDLIEISAMFDKNSKEVDEFRNKVMQDTLLNNHYDLYNLTYCGFVAKHFPKIAPFIETEAQRLRFTQFLERMVVKGARSYGGFGWILKLLIYSEDRLIVLDLLKDFLEENPALLEGIVQVAMKQEDGGDLVKLLLELFNPELVLDRHFIVDVRNIPAVDVCLRKNLDIEYVRFGEWSLMRAVMKKNDKKLMQHLIDKGGSIENAVKDVPFKYMSSDCLDVILKNKGDDFLHHIPISFLLPKEFIGDGVHNEYQQYYKMGRMLMRLKYSIPKQFIQQHDNPPCVVALMCFGYIKFEELNEKRGAEVMSWIRCNDVNVNVYTLPFLCKEIKERMMMFLMCINRTVGYIGKDLKMTLLDWIWSPF